MTEYGVPASEQLALLAIASRGGQHSWWHPYADVWSNAYLDYVIMESAAFEIMAYEAQLIPDLLQTDDYERAIAAAEPGYATDQQREEAVAAKAIRRQVILGASAERRLSVILGEAALRQAVGGPGVMAGQISHLVRLIDDFPGLTLQVLPFTAGAHAAAGSASLAILRFPDAPEPGRRLPGGAIGRRLPGGPGGRRPLHPGVRPAARRRAQRGRQRAAAQWPAGLRGQRV